MLCRLGAIETQLVCASRCPLPLRHVAVAAYDNGQGGTLPERAKRAEKASCGETVVQKGVFGESVSSLPPSGFYDLSGILRAKTLRGEEKKRALQKHPFGQPFLRTTPFPLLWRAPCVSHSKCDIARLSYARLALNVFRHVNADRQHPRTFGHVLICHCKGSAIGSPGLEGRSRGPARVRAGLGKVRGGGGPAGFAGFAGLAVAEGAGKEPIVSFFCNRF